MYEVQPTQGSGESFWDVAQSLCQYRGATQYKLRFGTTIITLPDAVADRAIREMVEAGWTLDRAYKGAGIYDLLPPAAMQPCIKDVYASKYIDENGEWQHFGTYHTCMGFHNCLAEYIPALVADPQKDPDRQRMQIAVGIFAPSPAEEACIRSKFIMTGDLATSYRACNCADVLPWWDGGIAFLQNALTVRPDERLYTATKLSYILYANTSKPVSPPVSPPACTRPVTPPAYTPPATDTAKKAMSVLWIGGIAVAAIALLRR